MIDNIKALILNFHTTKIEFSLIAAKVINKTFEDANETVHKTESMLKIKSNKHVNENSWETLRLQFMSSYPMHKPDSKISTMHIHEVI